MTTKEKKRLYNQNYHREHEAELRARALEWYRQNKGSIDKEERAKYMKAYRLANPEKWRKTPKQRAKINADRRQRYATDPRVREQAKTKVKEWQAANPDKRKNQRLKVHGIQLSDYNDMLSEQRGRCAICGYSDMSRPKIFPVVDHCHKRGTIRGLLCSNCNQGLGKFEDDPNLLFTAAMYIQRNS